MNRRQFIQIAGAGVASAAVLGGLTTKWYGAYADPLPDPQTEGERVVPTFCELCFWKCGVLAHVRAGRVTKLKGNPQHPLSRGRLCPRGAGGTGLLYDPDRLRQPLVRRAKRGEQVFEAVSWETALDTVAENFTRVQQQHGGSALALFYHGFGANWMKHLFRAYGSPNIAAPSYAQCRGPRDVGFQLTYGAGVGSPEITDIGNSRCLVLIGSHLGENMHNTQVQEFAAALRGGADVIVVDPRFSVAAAKARWWLPIKPGTDLALLLAWMNVLVTEGRYDRDYVERYTTGFEQLRAHVQPFTPEWAYPRTSIEPELIRATAHAMAGARPATLVHPGRHVTWYGNDTQRSRAIAILNALLGSWGRKGGFYVPVQMELPNFPAPGYGPTDRAGVDRPHPSAFPLADEALAQGLCDATIPGLHGYDLKAWMVYGSNILSSLPNPEGTRKAIQALDFLVSVDVLPAEICGWSDVVLPEATYLERCDDVYAPPYREPFLAVRQEVVPPMYESKPGWWIAKELAQRLGVGAYFPWADSLEFARARVHAGGYSCDTLQKDGVLRAAPRPIYFEDGAPATFDTPSGKIELYSSALAANGFDPMPAWRDGELELPPPGYYRLLFGRTPTHTFGRTTNNRLLLEAFAENEVWVHPEIAARHGLHDRQRVHLQNQDGVRSSFTAPVRITRRIRPDAVYIVHGFGHRAKHLALAHGRGIDSTELVTRVKVDPIMGGTGMNVNFVTFVPADPAGAPAAPELAAAPAPRTEVRA